MMIDHAIILAAGASSRLGQPKALVKLHGKTLIEHVDSRLRNMGLNVLVVTRSELKDKIASILKNSIIIINPNPDAGRTGSIQCGLLEFQGKPILLVPIDRPGFSTSTLKLLINSKTTSCPTSNGIGGHPVAISIKDSKRILDAHPDTSLRNIITPKRLKVNDKNLHLNIDTIDDLENLKSSLIMKSREYFNGV
jgi:molybdenum cofactor cytidylyltransferase